jgi:hypothetical protein
VKQRVTAIQSAPPATSPADYRWDCRLQLGCGHVRQLFLTPPEAAGIIGTAVVCPTCLARALVQPTSAGTQLEQSPRER